MVICLTLAAGLGAPRATAQEPVDVIIDSTDIELDEAERGTHVGKLTLSNVSDAFVGVAAAIVPPDRGCSITPAPRSLFSGRRTEIALTLSAGCDVAEGADVRVRFTPRAITPRSYPLTLSPAGDSGPTWAILAYSFFVGLAAALIVVVFVAYWIWNYNKDPDTKKKLKWNAPLNLGTDWSFKDNWVGNVTIGSAALVALLAASDVLEAILGEKPEAALGLIAVTGALAAGFVAVGPLLIKLIGSDMSKPTIKGMVVAGAVTLIGTQGQIVALTLQGEELTSGWPMTIGILALGTFFGSVVAIYAGRSLYDYAVLGSKPAPRQSEMSAAASRVAKAIRELDDPPRTRRRSTERDKADEDVELDDDEIIFTPEGDDEIVFVAQPTRNALL